MGVLKKPPGKEEREERKEKRERGSEGKRFTEGRAVEGERERPPTIPNYFSKREICHEY